MAYKEIKGMGYSIRRMHEERTLGYQIARRWEPWGVVAFFALLTAFLMRGWLGPQLPTSPRNEILPEIHYTQSLLEELRQGRLPAGWNALEFNGYPWLSFTSWPFYGLVALTGYFTRIPVTDLFKVLQLLCFLGSGLAMYLYVRSLMSERLPAVVAGTAYLWFPCHAHLGVETPYHSVVWALVPLILYADERMLAARGGRRWAWAVGLGALVALVTAITVEYTIVAASSVGAYVLIREVMAIRAGRSTVRHSVLRLAAASLVAFGLAAFIVVPQLEAIPTVAVHVKQGMASTLSDWMMKQFVVTPAMVLRAIARRTRLPIPYGQVSVVANSFWATAWYPGLLAPALAALGLGALRRQPVVRAVVVALALGLLQALDGLVPGNPFGFVPALNRALPFRSQLLVALFAAVLAGFGAQVLLARLSQPRRRWLALALAGLIVLDFSPSASAFVGVEGYFSPQEQAAQRWLAERRGAGYRLWEPGVNSREDYRLTLGILPVGIPRYWGYYDNNSAVHTWLLFWRGDLATALRLSSVRYVVLRPGGPAGAEWRAAVKEAGFRPVDWDFEGLELFEAADHLPYARAYPVATLQIDDREVAGLDLLPVLSRKGIALVAGHSGYLDDYTPGELGAYRYVFVDGARERRSGQAAALQEALGSAVRPVTQAALLPAAPAPQGASVIWQRPGPEDIHLAVSLPQGSVVTVAESYHPHWRVAVDGQPACLLRVNYAFLGAWVPAGEHTVVFYYERSTCEYLGALISLGTVLILTGVALVTLRRRLMGVRAAGTDDTGAAAEEG